MLQVSATGALFRSIHCTRTRTRRAKLPTQLRLFWRARCIVYPPPSRPEHTTSPMELVATLRLATLRSTLPQQRTPPRPSTPRMTLERQRSPRIARRLMPLLCVAAQARYLSLSPSPAWREEAQSRHALNSDGDATIIEALNYPLVFSVASLLCRGT